MPVVTSAVQLTAVAGIRQLDRDILPQDSSLAHITPAFATVSNEAISLRRITVIQNATDTMSGCIRAFRGVE
jgi:hypothetical protein